MNRGRRLHAPRDDRGVLVDPPWPELVALVAANRAAAAARPTVDLDGKTLAALAAEARTALVREARDYTAAYREAPPTPSDDAVRDTPLVLAGHQPELFHPGVWAKNFALDGLARAVGGVAVNLVIDGDTLKTPALRVPTGSIAAPHVESVPFDGPSEEIPYEERRVLDAATFESFGRRASDVVRPLVAEPLLETFWPTVVEESRRDGLIGAATARARHRLEGRWGLATLEYPQSRLCDSAGFAWFAVYLLAHLPEFATAHNEALAEYRRRERLRSANHPVPALEVDGEWCEAPLWIWTAAEPRRRRVFVRRTGRDWELGDRGGTTVCLPGAGGELSSAVAAWTELARSGVRLRSRALLTTMYARLVLGDVFLHGIGGGKYDELTDEIVRRFFKIEPPGFGIVTATRHLPLARKLQPPPDEAALRHRQWELDHHPERFVDLATLGPAEADEARARIDEKRRLLASGPPSGSAAAWCRAVRAVNVALRPAVAELRRKNEEQLGIACRQLADEAVLANREWASFLFPEKDLRDFLLAFRTNGR